MKKCWFVARRRRKGKEEREKEKFVGAEDLRYTCP